MKGCVLITGGAGFLGSHLCELMLKKGYEVICMDNLITGTLKNIEGFKSNKNFSFVKHDVTEHITVEGEIEYIMHFASPASPIDYLQIPIQTLKANALGTHNALGLAKAKKARFLLASTSEVYGDPQVHPQPESYWGHVNPVGPRGSYDESKRFAEALTMAYHRIHKVDTRIVRIFNTYGPRMRPNDGRAIPAFISQALNNEPLTVFGDGQQTRSFCFVSDLLDGIFKLLMSEITDPVNIGNPTEMTLIELAKKIIELARSKSTIIHKSLPVDDPRVRQPDITKARKELGWEPKVSIEEGLKITLDYFKNLNKQNIL
ncbi:MAG: UDP-glucuronic acid decarboxylase family protein [Candidatus Woesearchaeota archaeon]